MSDDEENGFRGHEDMRVDLPLSYPKIKIPQLFITEQSYETDEFERDENGKFKMKKVAHKSRNGKITYKMEKVPVVKKGWFLIDRGNEVINKTRNISTRQGRKLLNLQVSKVNKIEEPRHYIPRLAEFPRMEDRRKIYNYLTHLHPNEIMDFPHNKTRGLPPILPKNWKRSGFGDFPKGYKSKEDSDIESLSDREVSHEDIFGSDSESDEEPPTPKKKSPPKKKSKKIIPVSQLEPESDSEEEEEQQGAGGGRGRGRPRKHMTAQEAYDAKIKSNKDKRAERAKEARRLKIQEKLSKGEKLTKKERELHEAEGSGVKEDTIKNYDMILKHLQGHITDPKEPIDPKDYLQSNKIIKAIKKIKGGNTDPCWKGYEMVGMKTKKGKTVPNCVPTGGNVDFENINWGTFGALMKRFLKKNPMFKDKIEDLEHFALFVVANPDKFSKVAEKKARFYVNILEHKK